MDDNENSVIDTKRLPIVFVITPFGEDFLALFEELKTHFQNEYEFINAGDMDNEQNILKDIVLGISNADAIIADLSGNNANVFYELGLAHTLNKKVIIITQNINDLPFDIKSYRAFEYSMLFYKVPLLKDELAKKLKGAMDGSIAYGNPVTDFLPINTHMISHAEDNPIVKETTVSDNKPTATDADAGILDYYEEIREGSSVMMNEIILMGDEMSLMNSAVSEASSEINRVRGNGGNIDPAYVRKVFRKLGQPINEFSEKLNKHVDVILEKWEIVENSYLLMLESRLISNANNEKGLIKSKASLNEMKDSILDSNRKIESLIISAQSVLGYERTLNRAVNALVSSLEHYLQATDQMSASIDRIISKIDTVLGQ